jgi:hypothetical protein
MLVNRDFKDIFMLGFPVPGGKSETFLASPWYGSSPLPTFFLYSVGVYHTDLLLSLKHDQRRRLDKKSRNPFDRK